MQCQNKPKRLFRLYALNVRPYKKKILVLRHRRALKIPPDEMFLSWEGKKIAAARQISHADKYNRAVARAYIPNAK